jgi:hypothetical protein
MSRSVPDGTPIFIGMAVRISSILIDERVWHTSQAYPLCEHQIPDIWFDIQQRCFIQHIHALNLQKRSGSLNELDD